MSVRLSEEEAWEMLGSSHTGILTTLRRDGFPVTLPVWFVTEDRTVLVAGPGLTKKFSRVRHDGRASFLVESGYRWAELQAVQLDRSSRDRGRPGLGAHRRPARRQVQRGPHAESRRCPRAPEPATTRPDRSSASSPRARILSWDNARLDPNRGR